MNVLSKKKNVKPEEEWGRELVKNSKGCKDRAVDTSITPKN